MNETKKKKINNKQIKQNKTIEHMIWVHAISYEQSKYIYIYINIYEYDMISYQWKMNKKKKTHKTNEQ